MIVYLVFFVFVLIFIKDFRKGIIIYAPFKFVFSYGIPAHVGQLGLDSLFTFFLFVVWLIRYRNCFRDYPLKSSFIVALVGALVHAFNPFFAITVLLDRMSPFMYLVMFYWAIRNTKDFKLFFSTLVVYVLLLNVNALLEWSGYNVVGNILLDTMRDGTYWAQDVVARGIFVRLHSFVPHSIGFGVENMVFFAFFLMMYLYGRQICSGNKIIFLMLWTLLGIYLSGSRSPLLGGVVMLIPLALNERFFNHKNIGFAIAFSLVVAVFAGGYLSTMFESLSSDSMTDMGGASSFDMRLIQLEYSVYYWMQNFWFGNGHTFDIFQDGVEQNVIFGAESVWFPLMMRQGLIGMICYAFVYIDAFIKSKEASHKSICFYLMLGWLIIDSATNLPGINILFPFLFYTIYYKWNAFKQSCI